MTIRHVIGILAIIWMVTPSLRAQDKPQGVVYRSPGGTTLRVMIDQTNLGSEVSVGEMIFPPNSNSGEHAHGAIEIFYVVSGELEHVVSTESVYGTPVAIVYELM